jgi:hypothetical protein
LEPGVGGEVTGGAGSDTFILHYGLGFPNGVVAVVDDFKYGQDQIQFSGDDPNADVTNEGDLWTVHSIDGGQPADTTYEISGITHMQAGEDYIFV